MSDVIVERRDQAVWIRLNRPDRMNSFDADTCAELTAAVNGASDAGVIVITGSGRAFCAGGYLADLAAPDPAELRRLFTGALGFLDAIRMSPRPVIAAVNGAAIGGGNELVVACDFAIAAESAVLGQSGPRVGSAAVVGGTNLLAISVGEKRAKEISFLCRKYSAAEALDMGWINAVVPDHDLEAEVDRWCSEVVALSPRYLEIAKISSNVWWSACRDSYLSGVGMLTQAIGSQDMLEGAAAFMEGRAPQFPGRIPAPSVAR
jgi:enoyl-CoA hydratase/carnithine racemase